MRFNFQLTLTSIISTILFSLCFALLLVIVLKNHKLLSKVKYELLLLCLVAPIVKLIFPIEIVNLTYNINLSKGFPRVIIFLNEPIKGNSEGSLSRWNVLLIVIAIVSVCLVCWQIISYVKLVHDMEEEPELEVPAIRELVSNILAEYGKEASVSIKWSGPVNGPAIFGMTKPTIILPDIDVNTEQLENVLRHELAHYANGDLWICFGWQLLKAACWWNPAVYIFDRQVGKLLEIRADEKALDDAEALEMNVFLKTLVEISRAKSEQHESRFCAFFSESKGNDVRDRFLLIMERKKRTRFGMVVSTTVTCLSMLAMAVVMNCFIFEPMGSVPEDNYSRSELVGDSNSYLIENEDGTFDMYMNGVYCVTLDSTYGCDIPIYKSLEEALKNEEIR